MRAKADRLGISIAQKAFQKNRWLGKWLQNDFSVRTAHGWRFAKPFFGTAVLASVVHATYVSEVKRKGGVVSESRFGK